MRLVARPVRFGSLALLLSAGLVSAQNGAPGDSASPDSQRRAEEETYQEPAAPPAHSLRGIEVSSSPSGGDRVVLKLDGEPRYHLFEVEDPFRVVVDLEGTVNRMARNVTPVSSEILQRVRAGQYRPEPSPVARVVLDMNGRHDVQARAEGKNLVLDVASAISQDESAGLEKQPGTDVTHVQGIAPPASPGTPGTATTPTTAKAKGSASATTTAPPSTRSTTSSTTSAGTATATSPATGTSAPTTASSATAPTTLATPATTRGAAPARTTSSTPSSTSTATPTMSTAPSPTALPGAMPAPRTGQSPTAATGVEADEPPTLRIGSLPGAPSGSVRELGTAVQLAPAATEATATAPAGSSLFERKTIAGEGPKFTGKKISLNLVDADIRQVFRLFHEISGLNFVLDPSVSGRVTIVVDEVPWDQALDLILKNNGLDKVFENNVIRIATTQKLAQEAGARKALKEAKELETDTVTITRTLSYAKAREVDQIIKTGVLLSPRGKSFFDERTNTIIITDVPTKIEPLDKLLTSLDEKTTQVMIEARIVETTREFTQDLGIRWGFHGERSEALGNALDTEFPHNASVNWDLNLARNPGISQLAFAFSNVRDSFSLDIALDALETEGRARILSAPKIATRNNEEAEIEQGVRIPIVNTTATEISVEFVSASLKLKVTPQITAEGTVLLNLEVSNDTPELSIKTNTGTPGIRTQRAKTKVLVSDGGTTVIGGIFVINEAQGEFGVPFFRKIPFFGWLFKSRNITNENRELLVFVTPKIIRG